MKSGNPFVLVSVNSSERETQGYEKTQKGTGNSEVLKNINLTNL